MLPDIAPGAQPPDTPHPPLPEVYRTAYERLAMELAVGIEEAAEVFARHGYTNDQGLALLEQPAFASLLEKAAHEIQTNGTSFRMKARAMAEELLPTVFDMSQDPMISSAVRLDGAKCMAKWGGLEPKESKEDSKAGSGLTLQITFSGNAPQTIVSAAREPITIEGN